MIESIALVAIVYALYYRTFSYDYGMDDQQHINKLKTGQYGTIANFKSFIGHRLYGAGTFGYDPKIDHVFTTFLYAVICVLIYWALGHNEISFFTAILYACNPINNQISIWCNGRRYALNIIIVLLMMLIPLTSPILYPLTALLQVTAIFSPILLIGHSWWYLALMPVCLAVGWNQIVERCKMRSDSMPDICEPKMIKPERIIVSVKTFGFFFFKMIIPQVCAMQYPDRLKWGLTKDGTEDAYKFDLSFYQGIIGLASFPMLMFILPSNLWPYIAFSFLAILQWSAIIPITQILSDRYCSLPNVFMMFFVSYFAHFLGIFYIPMMVALIIYYVICLDIVLPMYKDLGAYYTYHFQYYPNLSWYRHNVINDLMNEGNQEMAAIQTFEGLKYDPKDFRLLMWGAIMSVIKKDLKNAETFLEEASKNLYSNQEEKGLGEIAHLREQIKAIKPIVKKEERLTARERIAFKRRR